MPFVPLNEHFPDLADRETRTITILDGTATGLPPGEYGFLESFCDERGCDCRRVFFLVMSRERGALDAVIAWGWESPDFYARWMGDDDPLFVAELKGPCLNVGSPQSEHAPALLDLVRDVLLRDSAYVERIKRHYRMFRQKIDGRLARRRIRGKRRRVKKRSRKA